MRWFRHPVAIGGLLFLSLGVGYGAVVYLQAPKTPRLECVREFELGEPEYGAMVTLPFSISNRGNGDLVIGNIGSSCGCTGISRKVGDEYERLPGLVIPPGATQDCYLRVRVTGEFGKPITYVVTFLTNDPQHAAVQIALKLQRLREALAFSPNVVNLGSLLPGRPHEFTIEVRDTRTEGYRIKEIRSSQPEVVTARYEPDDSAEAKAAGRVGIIRGVVQAAAGTELLGGLEVFLEDSNDAHPYRRLAFSGRVRPWFELVPGRLILPRRTANRWQYQGTVTGLFAADTGGEVSIGNLPPGVKVDLEAKANRVFLQVIVDATAITQATKLTLPVRWNLGDLVGEQELVVDVDPPPAEGTP